MLYLFLYLAELVDKIHSLSEICSMFFGLASAFIAVVLAIEYISVDKSEILSKVKKVFTITVSVFIISLIGFALPSKSVMYQMAGVYLGKQLNTTIKLDTKLEKISKIVDIELDKKIKELQGGK